MSKIISNLIIIKFLIDIFSNEYLLYHFLLVYFRMLSVQICNFHAN